MNATKKSPAQPGGLIPCPDCGGEGWVYCDRCHGAGCYGCDGGEVLDCEGCGGSGETLADPREVAPTLDELRLDSVARRWAADAKPCRDCGHPILLRNEPAGEGWRLTPIDQKGQHHACR